MGGVLVGIVAIVGGLAAKKICDLLGAPVWFAKVLFIIATIYGMYHLVIYSMPDADAWSIGFTTLAVSSGILVIGLVYLGEQEEKDLEE